MNLNNFSLKKKLSLLLFMPLAGLLLFAANSLWHKANLYSEMTTVEELAIFATKISA